MFTFVREAQPKHVESGLEHGGGWVVEVGCQVWVPWGGEGSHLAPSGAPQVKRDWFGVPLPPKYTYCIYFRNKYL